MIEQLSGRGRTGTGGQVTVVTKSGTNDVHGSVFEDTATNTSTRKTFSI